MHQHARRQAIEVADAIRLVGQHAGQTQQLAADLDAVADLQIERSEQSSLGPGFAGRRARPWLFGLIGLSGAAQCASQRIAAAGRLDTCKLQVLVGCDDAGKLDDLCVIEPQLLAVVYLLGEAGALPLSTMSAPRNSLARSSIASFRRAPK